MRGGLLAMGLGMMVLGINKQAGAELGQAQLPTEFGCTGIYIFAF